MNVTHSGTTYECAVAVKCEDDKYIKLYDANGAEIASFNGISDFGEYTISGGSFIAPCDCGAPIVLTTYSIGGRTIAPGDWISSDGRYYYEIQNSLISSNAATCNILLLFAPGTELLYEAIQESGKVIIYIDTIPDEDIVIRSVQITRT